MLNPDSLHAEFDGFARRIPLVWRLNTFSPSLLCGVADATEVAYALGDAHEGVAHVLLVL